MSYASSSYTSLYSSPSLPRATSKRNPLLYSQSRHFSFNDCSIQRISGFFCNTHLRKSWNLIVKASEIEEKTAKQDIGSGEGEGEEEEGKYEEYEVELEQPYGLKFTKGRDGGTYIDAIAPGGSADNSGMFEIGDKVIATRYYC